MSNSALAAYTAHRDAIGTGGESGEWADIAPVLARILEERLPELITERPVRNVYPYPVRTLNADWPILMIHHLRRVPLIGQSDTCWDVYRHDVQLILICGPWGASDPATMEAMGTGYIDPMMRVLEANPDLERMCKRVEYDPGGETWGLASYGPSTPFQSPAQYWTLTFPIQVYGQRWRMRRG